MTNPLAQDLEHVLAHTGGLWDDLRGARLFITGGTGFVGCWLLESLLWANDRLTLGLSVVALTRNASAFERRAPHLARHPAVALHQGDVRTFDCLDGSFSHVVHAAADGRPLVNQDDRLRMVDTIVQGTRRALELACRSGARRFLLTSSGAVYGPQPAPITHLAEEYAGAPNPTDAHQFYGESKRAAEMLCCLYAHAHLQPTIARCFTFVGPYLPLDVNFAVGNFVRDALNGGPIRISGDGTAYRSYLYAADLVIWLWTILLRGQATRPYNVGSETSISIANLAHAVARRFTPEPDVRIAKPATGATLERYVPSTVRVRSDLGVRVTVDLEDALTRTVDWYRGRSTATHVGN
jgi:dTDP-glucose 4,6-dehydratase